MSLRIKLVRCYEVLGKCFNNTRWSPNSPTSVLMILTCVLDWVQPTWRAFSVAGKFTESLTERLFDLLITLVLEHLSNATIAVTTDFDLQEMEGWFTPHFRILRFTVHIEGPPKQIRDACILAKNVVIHLFKESLLLV